MSWLLILTTYFISASSSSLSKIYIYVLEDRSISNLSSIFASSLHNKQSVAIYIMKSINQMKREREGGREKGVDSVFTPFPFERWVAVRGGPKGEASWKNSLFCLVPFSRLNLAEL